MVADKVALVTGNADGFTLRSQIILIALELSVKTAMANLTARIQSHYWKADMELG